MSFAFIKFANFEECNAEEKLAFPTGKGDRAAVDESVKADSTNAFFP